MELVVVLLFLLVLAGATPLVTFLLVRHELQRRLRVSPRTPTDAPTAWLWSPVAAARMHRRLQSAAAVARSVAALHQRAGGQPRLVGLARSLEREAINLDEQLVLLGRLHPGRRREAMPAILPEVARIEHVAMRLSLQQLDHGVDARLADQASAVQQLSAELDALDAANDELRRLERDAGLARPEPVRVPPPRPRPAWQRGRTRPTWELRPRSSGRQFER